ncbi:helix-turn-helix domain-containing protein [Mycoplasma sp. P36-A1]|uniref:helix-turn-helix domain-containing protein n=1 Tax=Mycoplasma sp. P36-A1 TaxID=3252900 RepID=UPI003C2DA09A
MEIGKKIKSLRLKNGLTLEELANRTELSKGFLSQLERDKTTTSIQTLLDILDVLGTSAKDFFDDDKKNAKIVFEENDCFEQLEDSFSINYLVPNAQKNDMEPILLTLYSKQKSNIIQPFEGQVFGYVLQGSAFLIYGDKSFKLSKGNSFYLDGDKDHYIENKSLHDFKLLWIATPPIF